MSTHLKGHDESGMAAVLALLFSASLIAGPLGVLAVRDRRRESAEAVLADIRAAVRRRLRGESLLSVQVVPATLTRPGRVVLSTPTGRSEERRVGKECRSRWSPYH